MKPKILVLTGGADPLVPEEQVAAFKQVMEQAGADYRVITYPGAVHAFTNPGADARGRKHDMPLAYDPEADRQSWQEMRQFLDPFLSRRRKGDEIRAPGGKQWAI